jgi:uncharacterized protein YkwD
VSSGVAALLAVLLAGTLSLSPAPVAAASSSPAAMAAEVTSMINRARTAQGLVPYKPWPVLAAIATDRAQRLVSTQILTHGQSINPALDAAGLQWYGWGEIIGYTTYPVGSQAVGNLYAMWDASPSHHPLMFSGTYNYVGVGFSTDPSGKTWSSIVFSETVDHTSPVAYTTGIRRTGTTLFYSWAGRDRILQTHTAGLRSFDLQYRVDRGLWRTIRSNTTTMAIRLARRAHGHTYAFRVRSRDRRGNLSAWTVAARIRVP